MDIDAGPTLARFQETVVPAGGPDVYLMNKYQKQVRVAGVCAIDFGPAPAGRLTRAIGLCGWTTRFRQVTGPIFLNLANADQLILPK